MGGIRAEIVYSIDKGGCIEVGYIVLDREGPVGRFGSRGKWEWSMKRRRGQRKVDELPRYRVTTIITTALPSGDVLYPGHVIISYHVISRDHRTKEEHLSITL